MQLIITASGQVVLVGQTHRIIDGVLRFMKDENLIKIDKIAEPTPENPEGMIWTSIASNAAVPSRREFFPSVIGAQ